MSAITLQAHGAAEDEVAPNQRDGVDADQVAGWKLKLMLIRYEGVAARCPIRS
jgi:hypothetical protein